MAYFNMDMSVLTELWRLTDPTEPRFCVAVIAIIFNPFFWNVMKLSNLCVAVTQKTDITVSSVTLTFPSLLLLPSKNHFILGQKLLLGWDPFNRVILAGERTHVYAGAALMALGSVFVISSFMALGVTGTFLVSKIDPVQRSLCLCAHASDAPGMKETGCQPCEEPRRHYANTRHTLKPPLMLFLLHPLLFSIYSLSIHWNASPIGVILTAVVDLSYKVAIAFEGPFTEEIYRQRSQRCKHK
ncbi:phosphatidylethanolamine N-methyltransferase [Sinocyclocheilus rhinocerous]|uniref:phosphatidylethanolamine N-methyltransferase n=1 Tax=Sinocyclocheilus rhinocerous TaxID=307959 RepID=UPI0007BACBF9|nr:PREDICTED: phosphatidylethanolamine N-methyltransferase [Sinocyclocheilus rhinocerous]